MREMPTKPVRAKQSVYVGRFVLLRGKIMEYVAKQLSNSDAIHWMQTAQSLRLQAAREKNVESRGILLRDASNADQHAARILERIEASQ